MEEFVDFHGDYRHLIKELFLFNRPWSKEKNFFYPGQGLKYKNINYYTNNFQRPILYPVLDYVNQYPNFSYFKIDNNFYLKENPKKDIIINEYNFDFNCKELDGLTNENNKELIINISKKYIENIHQNKISTISFKDIQEYGIRKPGHIFRLLIKLQIDAGKIDYNLNDLSGNATMAIKDTDAQIIAESFFDMPGQVYGKVTGDLIVGCQGATSVDCLKTLSGEGNFQVLDGRMPKLGSLEYLLKSSNVIIAFFIFPFFSSKSPIKILYIGFLSI